MSKFYFFGIFDSFFRALAPLAWRQAMGSQASSRHGERTRAYLGGMHIKNRPGLAFSLNNTARLALRGGILSAVAAGCVGLLRLLPQDGLDEDPVLGWPRRAYAKGSSDGDDKSNCKRRACTDGVSEAYDLMFGGASAGIRASYGDVDKAKVECPVNSAQLGRATWTYLHSLAAYFPDEPSERQSQEMAQFMRTFAEFYPCEYCAAHLQERLKSHPPVTTSRVEFSLWMCETHNEVNSRLGKPQFDCDTCDIRWRDGPGDGSCD